MITLEIDHTRFDAAMDGIRDALIGEGKDLVTILVDEHRALSNTIVNFVPPPIGQGSPKTLGEGAIRRDIYSLASEATQQLIDTTASRYGITQVDTYITTKSGDRIELKWDNIDWDGSRLPQLHQLYRNDRGRVPGIKPSKGKWKSRVVVPKGARDPYVSRVQELVGRFKAKFAWAAWRLGARFPQYITRHFGKLGNGAIAEYDLTSANPSIIFGARNPNIGRIRSSISNAFKLRAEAMKKRIKVIASGYNKDIAAGIRPKAHASESKPTEESIGE